MLDNPSYIEKGSFKKEDSKRKTEKCNNFGNDEKEQLRKHMKRKVRKVREITLVMIKKNRLEKMTKKKDEQTLEERNIMINNVQMCSMVDPCILTSPAFR